MSNRVQCDIRALSAKIKQVGERAVKGASTALIEGGQEIQKRAREYAPRDTGSLERAITFEYDRSGTRGRIQVFVYVDEFVRQSGTSRFVSEYAEGVHDYIAPFGSGAWGNISAKSAAKGPNVGGKYFERAIEEVMPMIYEKVERMAKKGK